MKMSDDRKKYLKEYKQKNLKRIPLEVSHDFYVKILQQAALNKQSVNGYIKSVLEKAIDQDDGGYKGNDKFRELLKKMGENMEGNK